MFTAWNPSVGLDCKGWRTWQSYCIITQDRLDELPKTSTITTISSSTSTTTSKLFKPSPTAWEALGCYIPTLEKLMSSEAGDPVLTVPKCQDICSHTDFRYAGVGMGNQCWCSSSVAGELAKNSTECNLPCSGDDKTICGGGKDRFNAFKALRPELESPWSTSSFSPSGSAQTQPISATATSSQSTSGATRYLRIL